MHHAWVYTHESIRLLSRARQFASREHFPCPLSWLHHYHGHSSFTDGETEAWLARGHMACSSMAQLSELRGAAPHPCSPLAPTTGDQMWQPPMRSAAGEGYVAQQPGPAPLSLQPCRLVLPCHEAKDVILVLESRSPEPGGLSLLGLGILRLTVTSECLAPSPSPGQVS